MNLFLNRPSPFCCFSCDFLNAVCSANSKLISPQCHVGTNPCPPLGRNSSILFQHFLKENESKFIITETKWGWHKCICKVFLQTGSCLNGGRNSSFFQFNLSLSFFFFKKKTCNFIKARQRVFFYTLPAFCPFFLHLGRP